MLYELLCLPLCDEFDRSRVTELRDGEIPEPKKGLAQIAVVLVCGRQDAEHISHRRLQLRRIRRRLDRIAVNSGQAGEILQR
jgi:hypothetical protein